MSGQFNKSNFEQNPSKMKKKRSKEWVTNNDSSLCDADILSEEDIRAIKDANWKEKHVPKASKKETKYRQEINRLESNSVKAPLSKAEEQKLKKLKKKHKKLYDYRHRDMESSHYGLRCCFVSLLVIATIVFTAAFGAYHIFVQKYTGVTLIELTGMLAGLYKADDNAYNQNFDTVKDSDRFFDNLQNALFLDTKFSVDDILNLIPTDKGGTGSENASVADLLDNAKEPTPSDNSSLTGNEYLDKLLADTKFDFSSLKDFNADKPTPIWEIEDKMIAAVLQQVVNNLDKILTDNSQSIGGLNINLKNSFEVKQCLITKNADSETTFSVALKIKISTIVTDILKDLDLREANFVKQIIPSLLPKNVYIHANITPEVDKAPTLGINSINEKSLQTLLNTLDSNLLEGKLNETLNKVGNSIFSTISTIQEMTEHQGLVIAPSTGEEPGAIKFDILSTTLKQMKVQNVSSSDFLLMVKHLHSIDFEYPTEEKYIEANGLTKSTIEAFNQSIIDLYGSYGVAADDCKDITPNNFLDKIEDIPKHINIQNKLKDDYIYNYSNDQLKEYSKLTDAALGQILNNKIKETLGDSFDLKLIQLKMTDKTLELISYIDIASIVSKQVGDQLGAMQPLIMSMFPNNVYINILVPYDKNGDLKTDIIFNYTKDDNGNNNKDDSDKMFDTIANLIAGLNSGQDNQDNGSIWNNFNKQTLINKLNDAIYPALEAIVPTEGDNKDIFGFTNGGLQLPTIYEILEITLNEGVTDNSEKMYANVIQKTMQGYYNYDGGVDKNNNLINNLENADLKNFISRELEKKLYFKNTIDETEVYNALINFGNNLSAENIDRDFDINNLIAYNDDVTKKNFAITSLELAQLIVQSGTLAKIKNIGFYQNFQLVDINVNEGDNTLSLRMAATLDESAEGIAGIDLKNFAAKYLIVSAIISLDENYTTKIKINSADDTQIDNLLKLIKRIIKSDKEDNDFNKDTVAADFSKAIKNMFEEFEKNGFALTASDFAVKDAPNDRCDGFTSTNIYEMISQKINKDNYKAGDGEMLKNVIYKLNNLPTKNGGGYCYTSVVMDPLTWKDKDGDGRFDADGIFEIIDQEGNVSVKRLYEITENASGKYNIKLHDHYFAQQIKATVDTDYAKLIKFGMFVNSDKCIADYKSAVTDLGLVDYSGSIDKDIVPRDLAANANEYGVMFMHFEISNSMIGADALANKILPNSIYGGSFITFGANMTVDNTYSFINNLTKAETDYLNSLMVKPVEPPTEGGGEGETDPENPDGGNEGEGETGGDVEPPVTRAANITLLETLDILVSAVLKAPLTLDISNDLYRYAPADLKVFTLEKLLQEGFILKDANYEGYEMQKYCFGTYVKTVDVTDLEKLPEKGDESDGDEELNG